MFLLKIHKASEARLWMLCFHWWEVTPWSNPTDLSCTTKICSPRSSQASKLRSRGTLFINSGCFCRHLNFCGALNLPAFSVHSSHLLKSFSAKSFCEYLLKSQDSERNTLNESLRMCNTGIFWEILFTNENRVRIRPLVFKISITLIGSTKRL